MKLHDFNNNKVTKGQPINMNPLHTETTGDMNNSLSVKRLADADWWPQP